MTAKSQALKDIKVVLDKHAKQDHRTRFINSKGKNPNWDVWTFRITHLVNHKKYFTS